MEYDQCLSSIPNCLQGQPCKTAQGCLDSRPRCFPDSAAECGFHAPSHRPSAHPHIYTYTFFKTPLSRTAYPLIPSSSCLPAVRQTHPVFRALSLTNILVHKTWMGIFIVDKRWITLCEYAVLPAITVSACNVFLYVYVIMAKCVPGHFV